MKEFEEKYIYIYIERKINGEEGIRCREKNRHFWASDEGYRHSQKSTASGQGVLGFSEGA